MSTSTEQEQAATPSAGVKLPPISATTSHNLTPLNREPSQQDIEIARQLQSFQSQGTNQHEHAQSTEGASPESRDEHDPSDVPQERRINGYASDAHPQSPPYAGSTAGSRVIVPVRSMPPTEAAPGGQMCSNCGTTTTPLWRRSPTGAVICNACGLYYKARNQMRPVGLKRGAGTSAPTTQSQAPAQTPDRTSPPSSIQGGATYVSADSSANGTCPGSGRCNGTGGHDGCNGCPAYNNRISKTAQVALRQSDEATSDHASGTPNNQSHILTHSTPQSVVVACQNCGTTITPLWRRDEAGNTICNACGLYQKLHGQHRPVQMKKAEIKRRKRVVPANMGPDGHSDTHMTEAYEDDRSTESHHNPHHHTTDTHQNSGPIPVDFTDTFRARFKQNHDHSSVPHKRAYSSGDNDSESYPHAQNIGGTSRGSIDPSLPAHDGSISKESRRAELQREAETMRKILMEKERELAALGDEG